MTSVVSNSSVLAKTMDLNEVELFRKRSDTWISSSETEPDDLEILDASVDMLVIAYNFAPFSDASAVTVAKRIRDFGVPVHVVSQDLSTIRKLDLQLTRLVRPYVTKHYQVTSAPTFAAWKGIAMFVAEAMTLLDENLKKGKYRRMYSRSMFPASHFLAAHIKRLYPNTHWIAEFSDPIRHTVEGLKRPGGDFELDSWAMSLIDGLADEVRTELLHDTDVFRWCETIAFENADKIWFTNEFQKEVMLSSVKDALRLGGVRKKSEVFSHPTLPGALYSLGKSSVRRRDHGFYIGYFGEFYANRGLDDLFKSLSMMHADDLRRIEVHVYTSSVDVCQRAVDQANLSRVVHVHGSLDFLDFCATAKNMDLLVVCDVVPGNIYEKNPYLPSKVSDYLGAMTNIMAFVWPGSVLSTSSKVDRFLIGDAVGGAQYITQRLKTRNPHDK